MSSFAEFPKIDGERIDRAIQNGVMEFCYQAVTPTDRVGLGRGYVRAYIGNTWGSRDQVVSAEDDITFERDGRASEKEALFIRVCEEIQQLRGDPGVIRLWFEAMARRNMNKEQDKVAPRLQLVAKYNFQIAGTGGGLTTGANNVDIQKAIAGILQEARLGMKEARESNTLLANQIVQMAETATNARDATIELARRDGYIRAVTENSLTSREDLLLQLFMFGTEKIKEIADRMGEKGDNGEGWLETIITKMKNGTATDEDRQRVRAVMVEASRAMGASL